MKMNKALALAILIISLLAITVASQISLNDKDINEQINLTHVNDKIAIEEKQQCTIKYYNETVYFYEYVPRTKEIYGMCRNATNQSNYVCVNSTESYQSYEVTGSELVLRNRTECTSQNIYTILINNHGNIRKKQIDFSDWGPCVFNEENDCLIVTCQSIYDGANDGRFHNCRDGTSCQRFEICDGSIKTLYKNSRVDFVEDDPTFILNKLILEEVPK